MRARHRVPRVRERDLVALVDGALPERRRRRVERALERSPELRASVAAQRRALDAIGRLAAEGAPVQLRARLAVARRPDAERSCGAPEGGRPPARRPLRRLGVTAAAAVAALALVLVSLAGRASEPSVAQAAMLALRAPVAPAPARRGDAPVLPGLRIAGLSFPYWEDRFGLVATGVRHDRLGGRRATSVYYRRAGETIVYTIVAGPPLAPGVRAAWSAWNGVSLHSFAIHGRTVVTWVRDGHTCVVSGRGAAVQALARLVAWGPSGRVSG